MSGTDRASKWYRDAAAWWALGGAVLVAALAFEWSRRYSHNVCDDALISFQYARNAAEGLGFVFNPGERVEGFTNFLWTALLALVHPLSGGTSAGFVRLAVALSILLAALDIVLLYRLGRLLWPHRVAPIVFTVGLCALDNGYTVWAMQALESHLLIFAMLLACLFLWGKPSRSNQFGAALSLVAVMMTRPDAALFVAVLGASELLWAWRSDQPKQALLRAIAIFGTTALLFGVYFLWRYQYFGYLLPNTFYVKASGLRGEALERGWRYLSEFLADRGYVPLLALGAVVGFRDRIVGPLIAWVLLYTAYVVYVGGDFYPGHRFFVVLIPFAALLSAYTLERVATWAQARWRSTPRPVWGVWAVGLALVALVAVRGLTVGPIQTEIIRWGHEVARVRAFMEWLGEQAPPGASIVTGDIGSSGFYANLYVYDYFGIIDPVTAHQEQKRLGRGKPGHEKHADPDYLLAKQPTYIKRGYIHRDLYRHGYFFESDIPARLNEPGIWRKDELREEDGWAVLSHIPFESQPYADWVASGEAFESWPSRTLSRHQQRSVGQVRWFVSSYHPTSHDAAVGQLRSASFLLEGDLLVIRVAGGRDPVKLRVDLLVDDEPVASATGNDSEVFARYAWDISKHRGSSAALLIVDDATGAWGHIMVDEIEQRMAGAITAPDIK
jgi:hypothetical protein